MRFASTEAASFWKKFENWASKNVFPAFWSKN